MNKCFNNYGCWHKSVLHAYPVKQLYSESNRALAPMDSHWCLCYCSPQTQKQLLMKSFSSHLSGGFSSDTSSTAPKTEKRCENPKPSIVSGVAEKFNMVHQKNCQEQTAEAWADLRKQSTEPLRTSSPTHPHWGPLNNAFYVQVRR